MILTTGGLGVGLYDFIADFARWSTRVSAFTYGLTDRYPPFSGRPGPGEDPLAAPADLAAEEPRAA